MTSETRNAKVAQTPTESPNTARKTGSYSECGPVILPLKRNERKPTTTLGEKPNYIDKY